MFDIANKWHIHRKYVKIFLIIRFRQRGHHANDITYFCTHFYAYAWRRMFINRIGHQATRQRWIGQGSLFLERVARFILEPEFLTRLDLTTEKPGLIFQKETEATSILHAGLLTLRMSSPVFLNLL